MFNIKRSSQTMSNIQLSKNGFNLGFVYQVHVQLLILQKINRMNREISSERTTFYDICKLEIKFSIIITCKSLFYLLDREFLGTLQRNYVCYSLDSFCFFLVQSNYISASSRDTEVKERPQLLFRTYHCLLKPIT